MADGKELTIYTLHRSHKYVQARQFNGRQKELTIYTLHSSHTYVQDRQFNGQKKDKKTINDLQNITHKTKDTVTRTLLPTGDKLRI